MDGTLTIGDFAKATQLGVKTLRHYHDVGLLVPDRIDAMSGYRYYAVGQIPVALVIRRFRDLDMPLGQIEALLNEPDPGVRSQLIAAHLTRLEDRLAETQRAVRSLRGLLEGSGDSAPIRHRRESALQVAAVSEPVEREDLGVWFGDAMAEVRSVMDAQHVAPDGPAGAVVADAFFADESGEIIVFVPVSIAVQPVGRVVNLVLPAVELAVIEHEGAHVGIDRTYGALASHVAERALSVDGPIRERYLVGASDTADASEWRTEIGWPIFRTAPA